MVLCLLLFFGSQFRLVNYFDSEIVLSFLAYFGKTRSEIGYSVIKRLWCNEVMVLVLIISIPEPCIYL